MDTIVSCASTLCVLIPVWRYPATALIWNGKTFVALTYPAF